MTNQAVAVFIPFICIYFIVKKKIKKDLKVPDSILDSVLSAVSCFKLFWMSLWDHSMPNEMVMSQPPLRNG